MKKKRPTNRKQKNPQSPLTAPLETPTEIPLRADCSEPREVVLPPALPSDKAVPGNATPQRTEPNIAPLPFSQADQAQLSQFLERMEHQNPSFSGALGFIIQRQGLNTFPLTMALVERLLLLDPLFEELEAVCARTPVPPSTRLSFQQFDRNVVVYLLLACFLPGLVAREKAEKTPTRPLLKKKARDIFRVLEKWGGDLSPRTQERLELEYIKAQIELALQKEWRGVVSGKCPAVSAAVTALASYFWFCAPLRLSCEITVAKDAYEIIRKVVECIANPSEELAPNLTTPRVCLVCGKKHEFKDWRRVWKRDAFRDKRGEW